MKLRDGQGKHILKQAMASSLPGDILTRRKMGFGVPLGDWFRGELREMVRDVLLSRAARERGLFRPAGIARLIEAHDTGRRDYSARLWALVCLELWMGQWLDGRASAAGKAA